MKVILLTTLLLFSVNGFAFNWIRLGKTSAGDVYYIDTANIKQHNGFVYYWELIDLLEPALGAKSAISKYKVDCGVENVTCLTDTYYSQSMGKGEIVFEDNPNKIGYPKPRQLDISQWSLHVRIQSS